MASVLVLGVAVIDHVFLVEDIPQKPEKYIARDAMTVGGGCAGNAAVAIARLGGKAFLSTRLGNDATAKMILNDLQAEGVDTSLSDETGTRSSCSAILVDAKGERQIVNFRGEGLTQDTTHLNAAPQIGAVLADTRWPDGAIHAMNLAQSRGVPGIMDVEADTDPACLYSASHLAFSQPGLTALYPELKIDAALLQAAQEFGAWCCVTLGQDGVAYTDGDKISRVDAPRVDVKDTTGAGDIWHGAFALGLAENMPTKAAIEFANKAAALKCTRIGGRTGAPTRQEVEQISLKGGA